MWMFGLFLLLLAQIVVPLPSEENISITCESEGRFSYALDCGSYIECVRDLKGVYSPKIKSCHGKAFHSSMLKCVDAEKVPGCRVRKSRKLTLPDVSLAAICQRNNNYQFVCADCKTTALCIDGKGYPDQCGDGEVCSKEQLGFGGAVCYPRTKQNTCKCTFNHTFYEDPFNKQAFFYCEEYQGELESHRCADGTTFDAESSSCKTSSGFSSSCTSAGVKANPKNCSEFTTCVFTANGWLQKVSTCGHQQMYSETNRRCEDPCLWNDELQFSCPSEGRFRDSTDCQYFFQCVQWDNDSPELHMSRHKCPAGTEWRRYDGSHLPDPLGSTFNCLPIITPKELCQPERNSETKCDRPDWCHTGTPEPEIETTTNSNLI